MFNSEKRGKQCVRSERSAWQRALKRNKIVDEQLEKTRWSIQNRTTYLPWFSRQVGNLVAVLAAGFPLLGDLASFPSLVRRQFRRQVRVGVQQYVPAFPPIILVQFPIKRRHPCVNEPVQVIHPANTNNTRLKHGVDVCFPLAEELPTEFFSRSLAQLRPELLRADNHNRGCVTSMPLQRLP